MSSKAENWRPCTRDARYEVSDFGRVRMIGRRVRSPKPRVNGYYYVSINQRGVIKSWSVAVLVLEAFVGPRPDGFDASHRDNDRGNNRLDNLLWETHAANCQRKRDHGTSQAGEKNPAAKITDAQKAEIIASPLSSRKIAPMYGITDVHVRRLRRRGQIA